MKRVLCVSILLVLTTLSSVNVVYAQEEGAPLYFIGLSNGEKVYSENVVYKTPAFGKKHFLLNGKDRFEYDQVKFYENETGFYLKGDPTGYGSAFYLREVNGDRIDAFSTVTTFYSAGSPSMPGGSFHSTTIDYYRKDGGQLEKMNFRNLRYDLDDNPASAAKLHEVKQLNTISGILYGVGAAMVIGGIAHSFSDVETPDNPDGKTGPNVSPLFFVGAVTLSIPWFMQSAKRKKMHEAMVLYNKDEKNY